MSNTITRLEGVTVNPQANVYFDGKCISHSITLVDGSKKTVGVILPATLVFNTGDPEVMECVGGSCEYRLPGSEVWQKSATGDKFMVPGNSQFEIRVTGAYHYICHFV
jgi:purine/pyrimidine-nucleoside phosphorylase